MGNVEGGGRGGMEALLFLKISLSTFKFAFVSKADNKDFNSSPAEPGYVLPLQTV